MILFRRDYQCPQCGSKKVSLHAETLPPLGEVDYWAPVRDEAFRCNECNLQEHCHTNAGAPFVAFHARWHDPIDTPLTAEEIEADRQLSIQVDADREATDRAWTWPDDTRGEVHDRAWRAARLAEERATERYPQAVRGAPYVEGLALDAELEARILEAPDETSARWDLVRWLRERSHPFANETALFIEGQLQLADAFKANPRAHARDELSDLAFSRRKQGEWWRYPRFHTFVNPLYALDWEWGDGLVADARYYRGFIEHVTIKASRFLEIADELYGLAPIRQLTITYCKGLKHDDEGLFKALLDSPHLDRIRALKLPVRAFGIDNQYTELNRLTDDDVAMLATSDHLRGLRVLDLEDQRKLSIAAFDALAASKKLPELSAVYSDIYHYYFPGTFTFGTVGGQQRHRVATPLDGYAPKLEARYGWIPWLHVAEYYGDERPDIEAVIENPIAIARPRSAT